MSLPRFAWILNQDAELELTRPGYTPAARTVAQSQEHGAAARALLGERDVLLAGDLPQPELYTGRAWCPTPLAIAQFRAVGVRPEPFPSYDVLRTVNHRQFAFALSGGLPDQHYVQSRTQIDALLRPDRAWLLKRPLGFAGRGQLRILGAVDPKQESWIAASLRHDGLIMEPVIKPLLEVSLHGFIWRDQHFNLGRPCVQEVSDRGVFQSVRLAKPGELSAVEHQALFSQGDRVATALVAAGYFGPFGIDAYRYERGGAEGFCALSEINARYTMGFVTGYPAHPSEIVL